VTDHSRDAALHRRRSDRARFLRAVYDAGDADVGAYQDGREIADRLGISVAEAGRIVRYFEDRQFLRHVSGAGLTVHITAAGIDHVETLSTEH